jgi:hypothetical protein
MATDPVDPPLPIESDESRESSGEIDEHLQQESSTSAPTLQSAHKRSRSSSSTRSQGAYTDEGPPPLPREDIPAVPSDALPVLDYDDAPQLPNEQTPADTGSDDDWTYLWDHTASAWYFYNRRTHVTQWENPKFPSAPAVSAGGFGAHYPSGSSGAPGTTSGAPGTTSSSYGAPGTSSPPRRVHGGYNPAIHGDYDPNADYALEAAREEQEHEQALQDAAARAAGLDPTSQYAATGYFNRFTGRWQAAALQPENFNDENKSKRQMSAFFDVDAAANNHDGRSLKAERQGKKLSKQEVKKFKEKRREKKEEKRRAWLMD